MYIQVFSHFEMVRDKKIVMLKCSVVKELSCTIYLVIWKFLEMGI